VAEAERKKQEDAERRERAVRDAEDARLFRERQAAKQRGGGERGS